MSNKKDTWTYRHHQALSRLLSIEGNVWGKGRDGPLIVRLRKGLQYLRYRNWRMDGKRKRKTPGNRSSVP